MILCGFAGAVAGLTSIRLHQDFDQEVERAAGVLKESVTYQGPGQSLRTGRFYLSGLRPDLNEFNLGTGAIIRIINYQGYELNSTRVRRDFGPPVTGSKQIDGYRVEARRLPPGVMDSILGTANSDFPPPPYYVQYARPLTSVEETVGRLRLFLVIGVLGFSGLALLAGLMVARRAMAPIAALTAAARRIERTRDPGQRLPDIEADDEVAELARTLEDMLRALDAARAETEGALARQREFVADASHELRTPLTSVLANLELLADSLDGDQQDAAHSALRSSRRMRRLVADLLLLARHDAARQAPHTPTNVGQVLIEAAAELGLIADEHALSIEPNRALVDGARDELHRLALNLMENAIRHTPRGTHVRAAVERVDDQVRLTVEDDGPGIPDDLRSRVFERFVRGVGDRGGSSGLGLSIVHAVAESHGGTVTVQSPTSNGAGRAHGTRFEVTLPLSASERHAEPAEQVESEPLEDPVRAT
ncbi:MAG TPA: HAMP domain-containing sensor histidine kinase [Solirubrobacteraceae bacterium]